MNTRRGIGWWVRKLPTIIKYVWRDIDAFVETYTTSRLWVTLILIWLGFAIGAKLSEVTDLPFTATFAIAQILLQGAIMVGMAIIQFVAIFWFMGRTKTEIILPGDKKSVTFADYIGQPNLVKMMRHWLILLQNKDERKKLQSMGGKFPTGILLYGPPGTGKTLLAKCAAGEGEIAFLSIEASGFQAMFWGVDVIKMMAFCGTARKLARRFGACIAYIDEVDAIGGSRGGVMGAGQQIGMNPGGIMGMGGARGALTRLLYEMDGMDENFTRLEKLQNKWRVRLGLPVPPRQWHVLYMGSTNRPDALDAALMREGRFDRKIEVSLPDAASRRLIIGYYLSKIAHDDSIDIEALVKDTPWASPAKIASAFTKDAVRLALAAGRDKVSQGDILIALQEQALGLETPVEEMPEEQRIQVAYHEAGHAVASHRILPEMRIVHASIVKRNRSLGHVMPVFKDETFALPLDFAVRDIMVDMAGQVSTMLKFGCRWTGTDGDYANANWRINGLLMAGVFGPPIGTLEELHRLYSKEIQAFWTDAEAKTTRLLYEHWQEVVAVAEALLEKGTVEGDEIVRLIEAAAGGHHE